MKELSCLVAFALLLSCSEPCCEGESGPPSFYLEIVDAGTNSNVFTNGTFT